MKKRKIILFTLICFKAALLVGQDLELKKDTLIYIKGKILLFNESQEQNHHFGGFNLMLINVDSASLECLNKCNLVVRTSKREKDLSKNTTYLFSVRKKYIRTYQDLESKFGKREVSICQLSEFFLRPTYNEYYYVLESW